VLLYGALLWIKASGHTAGIAGASVSVAFASLEWGWAPFPLLGTLALLAAVSSARVRLRAHTPQEIAWGFVFGALPMGVFVALRP
jgi:membrane-associated phospholipid phosphatase